VPGKLILVRHGQSVWNVENLFTGWHDVDLSDLGRLEAAQAGRELQRENLEPKIAFTSVLKRAIRTLWVIMDTTDRMWIPVERSWRLNERHYGALEGLNKAQTVEKHGESQVKIWRRSYDIAPPVLSLDDPRHPRFDPRYADVDAASLPAAETRKIDRELGWKPKATFESGIRKTVRWYLENEEWVRDVTSGSYRQWVATHYSS